MAPVVEKDVQKEVMDDDHAQKEVMEDHPLAQKKEGAHAQKKEDAHVQKKEDAHADGHQKKWMKKNREQLRLEEFFYQISVYGMFIYCSKIGFH